MKNPYVEMLKSALSEVQPLLPYFIFAVVFILALKVLEARFGRKRRGRWRRSPDWGRGRGKVVPFGPRHDAAPDRATDAADQLRTVMQAEFKPSDDDSAYRCINSKRVDLLIVDEECRPLHAIEYQGGGHFKGAHATAARDAVKKEALRRAGIGYIEVVAGDTPAELRRVVEKLVQRSTSFELNSL